MRQALMIPLLTMFAAFLPSCDSAPDGVFFNNRALSAEQLAGFQSFGLNLPHGHYWYDRTSGAAGAVGGPTAGFLPAGLQLGGELAPNCSGTGTGVFVNSRELHSIDHAYLNQITGGAVPPGRYFCDSWGNAGPEGGGVICNLRQLAARTGGGGGGGGITTSSVGGTRTHVGVDGSGGVLVWDSEGGYYSN